MLNINEYFNSPDIRNYYRKVNKKFNDFEKMCIIHRSDQVSLEEKIKLYTEMADNISDNVEIPNGTFSCNEITIKYEKEFILKFIESQKKLLELYYEYIPDTVYELCVYTYDGDTREIYKSVNLAIDSVKKYKFSQYIISKVFLCDKSICGSTEYILDAHFTKNNKISRLWLSDNFLLFNNDDTDKALYYLSNAFEYTSYYMDIPFKCGSIVCSKHNEITDPFVYLGQSKVNILLNDEYSNMIADGYFISSNYTIRLGCMHNYPDLELVRFRKTLYGYNYDPIEYELLKEVSRHCKEGTPIELLEKNYKNILKKHLIDSLNINFEEEFECLPEYK